MKLFIAIAVIAAGVHAGVATASNQSNAVFDQIATEVAGKPVAVHCEDDWYPWIKYFEEDGLNGTGVNGFTFSEAPVVFVSPRQCETLWALHTRQSVGTYYAASAIFTLAHEAVHQRGIADEGLTDCTAMPLVAGIAVKYFGITETITERYLVPRTIRRTVTVARKKKTITVRTTVPATRVIPNPWFEQLKSDTLEWHEAKPAEYQGTC
jgi:hypothetical protein